MEPVNGVRRQRNLEEFAALGPVMITGPIFTSSSSSGQFITCSRMIPTAWPTAAGAGTVTLVNAGGTFLVYYPPFATFSGNLICVSVGDHYFAVGNL